MVPFFVSMLLIVVVYLLSISCFAGQHFALGLFLFALLICGIPCMAVKSLQYQANMTSLNDIRFGFNCSMMRAWWVMLGLPGSVGVSFLVRTVSYCASDDIDRRLIL